jgi:hypothetical protein
VNLNSTLSKTRINNHLQNYNIIHSLAKKITFQILYIENISMSFVFFSWVNHQFLYLFFNIEFYFLKCDHLFFFNLTNFFKFFICIWFDYIYCSVWFYVQFAWKLYFKVFDFLLPENFCFKYHDFCVFHSRLS